LLLDGGLSCVVSPGDDWSILEAAHPNALVVGPRDVTRAFLAAIAPWLPTPVVRVACDTAVRIPVAVGTLILDDVESLPSQEQQALLHWCDMMDSVPQLIALTTEPLYRRVQSGAFLEPLYSRLNMVHLQVRPG
jgi:hypothetical protein